MTMSPAAQEKLERISEIQVSMHELEAELENLLGGAGPKPLTILDKQREKKEKPNGGKGRPTSDRTCGKCLKKGHNARTCPENISGPRKTSLEIGEPLTESQWDEVKESQKMDINTGDIADSMGVELREINKAMMSRSYDGYLTIRKKD